MALVINVSMACSDIWPPCQFDEHTTVWLSRPLCSAAALAAAAQAGQCPSTELSPSDKVVITRGVSDGRQQESEPEAARRASGRRVSLQSRQSVGQSGEDRSEGRGQRDRRAAPRALVRMSGWSAGPPEFRLASGGTRLITAQSARSTGSQLTVFRASRCLQRSATE